MGGGGRLGQPKWGIRPSSLALEGHWELRLTGHRDMYKVGGLLGFDEGEG